MPLYGQTIRWTDRKNRTITAITVDGRLTAEAALKDAVNEARYFGWTPPKWYEWWRKHDTKPDLSLIKE
jgi:hypothetical protein